MARASRIAPWSIVRRLDEKGGSESHSQPYSLLRRWRWRVVLLILFLIGVVGHTFLGDEATWTPGAANAHDVQIRLVLDPCEYYQSGSYGMMWKSLRMAFQPEAKVVIELQITSDECGLQLLEGTEYTDHPFASVEVVRLSERDSPIPLWTPASLSEYAIFPTGNDSFSPLFLQQAERIISKYGGRRATQTRVMGISLNRGHFDTTLCDSPWQKCTEPPADSSVIHQQPPVYGGVFFPHLWPTFAAYVAGLVSSGTDPLVPNLGTNAWDATQIWQKYAYRYCAEYGAYFIYPNLPSGLAFVASNQDFSPMDNLSARHIHLASHLYAFTDLPFAKDLEIYNLYHKRVESIHDLAQGDAQVSQFDTCTLLLNVYDRVNTLADRLAYYETLPKLDQILVLWNHQDLPPPDPTSFLSLVPVQFLHPSSNSLNWRFYPWPEIRTDCVIQMDDDMDMPFEHLEYTMWLWKTQFFQNMVGVSYLARNHVMLTIDGVERVLYSPTFFSPGTLAWTGKKPWASLLLPTGMVHHREYLRMYTNLPKEAHDIVDTNMNGEDLLMNFMVQNATGNGPVFAFIKGWATGVPGLFNQGLWSKGGHLRHRSELIESFIKIFGRNPLRYTTTFFSPTTETPPWRANFRDQSIMPNDYPCNRSFYEKHDACELVTAKKNWTNGTWIW